MYSILKSRMKISRDVKSKAEIIDAFSVRIIGTDKLIEFKRGLGWVVIFLQ